MTVAGKNTIVLRNVLVGDVTFTVSTVRVHNSSFGGTKNILVQVSTDGKTFATIEQTEFENCAADVYELKDLSKKGSPTSDWLPRTATPSPSSASRTASSFYVSWKCTVRRSRSFRLLS